MSSYICITHALNDLTAAARLSDILHAYGFSCRRIHEAGEPRERRATLLGAAFVLALTSPDADRVGTVAEDLNALTDRGRTPLCISLSVNALDERFCSHEGDSSSTRASRPVLDCLLYPDNDTPTGHPDGLFLHRLLIRRLVRVKGLFSPTHCRADAMGRAILCAHAANGGDLEAAYALGCAYERGEGVPVLEREAAAWISKAAEGGVAMAKLHLGELTLVGWGVEPDVSRARAIFAEVAASGDADAVPRAEYRLGLCYLNGVGVVADPCRAMRHLRRAADADYPPALFRVGLLLRDGVGVAPDPRQALAYLYRACRTGAGHDRVSEAAFDASLSANDFLTDTAVSPEGQLPIDEMSASDMDYPLPPALYGSGKAYSGHCVSLRAMRPRLQGMIERKAAVRTPSSTRKAPAPSRFPFARSRYACSRRPEAPWFAALIRASDAIVGGASVSGHPAVYIERDDVAMGVPFVLSDVAVAIGGLLASGGGSLGCSVMAPRPTRALVWYRYALRRGNAEALFRLAEAYSRGLGTPADPAWATVLYRMSAEWGDVRGQFAYAVACERGIGVETNMAEAIRYYQQAADAGYPPAQNNLGGCYEYGIGVSQNRLTAVEWYTLAADAGLPEAMCRLGLCCECGRGVPIDPVRAFQLYEKAAEKGNGYAQYRLGVCYDLGSCAPPDDLLRDAFSDEARLPYAPNRTEAINHWIRAARAGVADASFALSMCYAYGHGVRMDPIRALRFLRAAAEGGSLCALYRLAMCYMEGKGVRPDPAHAAELLEEAVHLWQGGKSLYLLRRAPHPAHVPTPVEGAADALYMLGYCRLSGIGKGAEESNQEARVASAHALFSEAADLGHVGAATALGDLYTYGYLQACDGREETARLYARIYAMRAVLCSATRRAVPCPLLPEDAEFCRHNHLTSALPAEMPLLSLSVPDAYAQSALASGADALSVHSAPALLSLAKELLVKDPMYPSFDTKLPPSTPEEETARRQVWRYFSDAAAQGSSSAHVGLSFCAYFGWGIEKNPAAALPYLRKAVQLPNSGIQAFLWLGDSYRAGWGGESRMLEADNAYLGGLNVPLAGSEVSPYIPAERKEAQIRLEREARRELLYRLSNFRSLFLSDEAGGDAPMELYDGTDRRETFSYFAEAVLLGHPTAREDLARMYVFEKKRQRKAISVWAKAQAADRAKGRRANRRGNPPQSPKPSLREHRVWLSHYYLNCWKEPKPFSYEMQIACIPSEIHEYTQVPVTDVMMADALNYLGECYFEGQGLPRSASAAATCFGEVAGMARRFSRENPAPASVAWAQYSYGWCLLKGKGVRQDERQAVRLLTEAARTRPEACLLLATCYEEGIGVDKIDPNEAAKYARRASDLRKKAAAANRQKKGI